MQLPASRLRIVCLGGSARALQAYSEILRGVPDDLGMAFVIIAHRGAENADLLPELLSRATKMRVVELQHGMRLKPNTVFLAPPKKDVDNRFCARSSTELKTFWLAQSDYSLLKLHGCDSR
jgi:two-component system, chemotaxis family, CheB/CheR fusion protein